MNKTKLINYTCHSGGCAGADMTWETEGNKYGVKTVAYSFYNHIQDSVNQKILTVDELNEGFKNVMIAAKSLKLSPETQGNYTKNLLSRNWFQVKNSDAIFAISKKFKNEDRTIVDGGTGWAVQMAVDNNKPIFVFDQPSDVWHTYDYTNNKFEDIGDLIPKLTHNFAGIGTRDINDNGINAIKLLLYLNQ